MNVLDYVNYNPETGELTWSQTFMSGCHTMKKDNPVSMRRDTSGHLTFRFMGGVLKTSNVVWEKHHGEPVPCDMIVDHINCIRGDNRASNLRLATKHQNNYNASCRKDNALGVKGVKMLPSGRFYVRVKVNKIRHSVGTFDTIEQAVAAADEFRKLHHGEFANNG